MANVFTIRMLTNRKGLPRGCAHDTYLDVPESATFGRGHAGRMEPSSYYFMYWNGSEWTRRTPATLYVKHSGETLTEEIDFEILRFVRKG